MSVTEIQQKVLLPRRLKSEHIVLEKYTKYEWFGIS